MAVVYWEQSSCVPSSRWLQREKRQGVEALLGYVRKKKAGRVSVNEMEENQID